MNPSLVKYILDEHTSTGNPIFTRSEKLKKRLDLTLPELGKIVHLCGQNDQPAKRFVHLSELVRNWTEIQPVKEMNPIEYKKYTDVVDESYDIMHYINHSLPANGKCVVVTDNQVVKMTLEAIMGIEPNYRLISENELWIQSAESIFLLNKIDKIIHCCNHKLVQDNMKGNFVCKNYVARNEVVDKFSQPMKGMDYKTRYDFADLLKIHSDFLNSISQEPISLPLKLKSVKMQITILEYVQVLRNLLDEWLKEQPNLPNTNMEIVELQELPFLDQSSFIWLAGLSCETSIDVRLLSMSENLICASYSSFINGQKMYPQLNIKATMVDKAKTYDSYEYNYTPPKPKVEYRRNTFAINHVTKLLNNPHNFYVENILRLKPYTSHLNHVVGVMIHAVLEQLMNDISEFHDYSDFYKRMNTLLEQYHFNKVDFIAVFKKVEVMLNPLWTLVKNADAVHAEREGKQTIVHNNQSYHLHGRADLIYEKDGKWGVIDFKTGNPPNWTSIIDGSAPQIGISMLMLRFGGFLGMEVEQLADSGFISPKGLFVVSANEQVIQTSINGIKEIMNRFWEEGSAYYIHLHDPSWPYRSIARSINEVN